MMPETIADPAVQKFISNIDDAKKIADIHAIIEMMENHTGKPARLVGTKTIGFGRVKYQYPSGRSGETFITGFAPQKTKFSLHILWYQPDDDPLLAKLGKHKRGKGCLYINRLSDININILDQIIHRSATDLSGRYIVENYGD
ncbi:hypothetical protein MNBD_ALPHA11-1745 [hydrothermal vent metagenome]|uniref:YdhG-like domain-containing protein n=1 Tax=hydrothermal vent metagenome TaxID=652676 RepID=A0A3B0U694_9ZZZZ